MSSSDDLASVYLKGDVNRQHPTSNCISLFISTVTIPLWSLFYISLPDIKTYILFGPVIVILTSMYLLSIRPLLSSKPLKSGHSLNGILSKVRSYDGSEYRALNIIFFSVILVPKKYENRLSNEDMYHELSHVVSGDSFYYTIYFPVIVFTCICSFFIAFDPNSVIFSPGRFDTIFGRSIEMERDLAEYVDENIAASFWNLRIAITLFFILPVSVITFGAALSIQDREFQADHFAYSALGTRYYEHLLKRSKVEKYKKPKNILVRIANGLTHPSIEKRRLNLLGYRTNLMSLTFTSGFVLMAYFIFIFVGFSFTFFALMESLPVETSVQIAQLGSSSSRLDATFEALKEDIFFTGSLFLIPIMMFYCSSYISIITISDSIRSDFKEVMNNGIYFCLGVVSGGCVLFLVPASFIARAGHHMFDEAGEKIIEIQVLEVLGSMTCVGLVMLLNVALLWAFWGAVIRKWKRVNYSIFLNGILGTITGAVSWLVAVFFFSLFV